MPPVTAAATAATRSLSSSPSFASISTPLYPSWSFSISLSVSGEAARAFRFLFSTYVSPSPGSLARPLRTPPESPPPPTDSPLSPKSLNGVAEPPEPAINPTPSFSSLFLVPATSRLDSRSHFGNDRLLPPSSPF